MKKPPALPRTVASPPVDRPLLIWDGECATCQAFVSRWRRLAGRRVASAPYQEAAGRFPEIPRETFAASVLLIEKNGVVRSGAEAVCRSLRQAPGGRLLSWCYGKIPPFAFLLEWGYGVVAKYRPRSDRP